MNYAKVENGQVVQVGLPKVGILTQGENAGCTVSGYDKLDEATLLAEGWLPVFDNPPEYDPETQYLEHAGYTIVGAEILAEYNVKQREYTPAPPTPEEKIADLEAQLAATNADMQALMEYLASTGVLEY
ncbi:MAG TPA: hypothetical protein VEG39_01840 [Clostridia bacterium]|nr:hypothetical protein [Clostridia bacterium]